MIRNKLNKIVFIFFLLLIAQCYKSPFFELRVVVVDQKLNPVSNVSIIIEVTDVSTGDPIDGSMINFSSNTDNSGKCVFSFDNKAFVTVRACPSQIGVCKEGYVYLEENSTKELTLMLEEGGCSYCVFP